MVAKAGGVRFYDFAGAAERVDSAEEGSSQVWLTQGDNAQCHDFAHDQDWRKHGCCVEARGPLCHELMAGLQSLWPQKL